MQFSVADALGTSDIFLAFQENVARGGAAERPVLVLGERGTGKELAAQRLHYLFAPLGRAAGDGAVSGAQPHAAGVGTFRP